MSFFKVISSLFSILLLAFSTVSQPIVANGNIISEIRDIKGINEIVVQGNVRIEIKQSEDEMVVVTSDENIIPFILTTQNGSTLSISKEGKLKKVKKMVVVVHVKELNKVVSHGSSDIKSDGFLSGGDLTIEVQGSSDIDLSTNYTNILIRSSGSGNVGLFGSTNKLDIQTFGSGNVSAYNCMVSEAIVSTKGSGNVRVAPSSSLNATLAGSGNINYKGNPNVTKNISGTGTIEREY